MTQATIEQAWEERDSIGPVTKGAVRQAVDSARVATDQRGGGSQQGREQRSHGAPR